MSKSKSPKVFISYSHNDSEIAVKLKRVLEENGIEVWIDKDSVQAGESISDFIERSVKHTDVTLAVVSNNSLSSPWVGMETINTFIKEKVMSNKRFIACYIDDDFLQTGFVLNATKHIDDRIAEIDRLIPQYIDQKIDTIDLNDEKTRFHSLRNNLGVVVRRLKESVTLDIRENKFADSLSTIISSIKKIDPITLEKKGQDFVPPKQVGSQTDFSFLGQLSNEEIHRMLTQFKSMVTLSPDDGEAHYSLGLCYLQLRLYELAIKNFKRAIQLMPEFSDVYYYYALSLIRGRRPKTMSRNEVKKIEEYLATAIQLDDQQAKYYYLVAILKYDYYLANGLSVKSPPINDLLQIAQEKEQDSWEVERLLQAIILRDEELVRLIRNN